MQVHFSCVCHVDKLVLKHSSEEISIFAEITCLQQLLVLYSTDLAYISATTVLSNILNVEGRYCRSRTSEDENFNTVYRDTHTWRTVVELVVTDVYLSPFCRRQSFIIVSIVFCILRCRLQIETVNLCS